MKKKTRLRSASVLFTTMGELYVETGLSEINMSSYRRILSLDSAILWCNLIRTGYGINENISYPHHPDSVMVMKFTADKGGKTESCA